MTEEIKQAAKQLKSIVGLGMSLDECESFMGSCMQSYHTAKLEEVSELPSDDEMKISFINETSKIIPSFEAAAWMRSIAQSVIAKKDAEISTLKAEIGKYAEVYGKTSHELQQAKAEIANLKEANDVSSIACPYCNGDGYTSEHANHPHENGDCHGQCPIQVQCDECLSTGRLTTEMLKEKINKPKPSDNAGSDLPF